MITINMIIEIQQYIEQNRAGIENCRVLFYETKRPVKWYLAAKRRE